MLAENLVSTREEGDQKYNRPAHGKRATEPVEEKGGGEEGSKEELQGGGCDGTKEAEEFLRFEFRIDARIVKKEDSASGEKGIDSEKREHRARFHVTERDDVYNKTSDKKRWNEKTFVFFVEVFHGGLLKEDRDFDGAVVFGQA